jgi:hypothetical protein
VIRFFLAFLVLTAPLAAQTQNLTPEPSNGRLMPLAKNRSLEPPPPAVQMKVEKFFLGIQEGKIDDSFTDLFAGSKLTEKQDQLDNLVTKTKGVIKEIGPANGYELINNESISSRLLVLSYFSYHPEKPLRWRIIFYAGKPDEWRVINLTVDDLVSESALSE